MEGDANMATNNNALNNRAENERKIFCGGLSKGVSKEDLKEYFSKYGPVEDVNLKMDNYTNQSRGFGFILFESKDVVDEALCCPCHELKGKKFETKQAEGPVPLLKVFAGGLPRETTEEDVRAHFEQFGNITGVNLAIDKVTKKFRGFAFITYECEDMADNASAENKQMICGKRVDVKKAQPEGKVQNGRGGGRGGRGGRFGQDYNSGYGFGGGGYDYYNGYNDYYDAPYDSHYSHGHGSFNGYGSGYNNFDSYGQNGGYGYNKQGYNMAPANSMRGRYQPY